MKMSSMIFKCDGEVAISHFLLVDRNVFDFIEEQLYILWELVPINRAWKAELQKDYTVFTYGNSEYFIVTFNQFTHTVNVESL